MKAETLNAAGDLVLMSALPAVVLFILFYGIRSPWRSLFVGRSMMYLAISLAAVLSLGVIRIVFNDQSSQIIEGVRLAGYIIMTVFAWRLFFTLLRIQAQTLPRDGYEDADTTSSDAELTSDER